MPLTLPDRVEACSVEYRLAIDWGTALDGSPVRMDDGPDYDSLMATMTLRLTPSELTAMEGCYQDDRILTVNGDGRVLGPEIDTLMGVPCSFLSLVVDGPSDPSCTLYDATIQVGYGPLPALVDPPGVSSIFEHGVPYHSVRPYGQMLLLEDGRAAQVGATARSNRSTKWYTSGVPLYLANSMVRALRNLRGGQFPWGTFGVSKPWGPGEPDFPNTYAWIPSWTVSRESNLSWLFELEVVRDG